MITFFLKASSNFSMKQSIKHHRQAYSRVSNLKPPEVGQSLNVPKKRDSLFLFYINFKCDYLDFFLFKINLSSHIIIVDFNVFARAFVIKIFLWWNFELDSCGIRETTVLLM